MWYFKSFKLEERRSQRTRSEGACPKVKYLSFPPSDSTARTLQPIPRYHLGCQECQPRRRQRCLMPTNATLNHLLTST